MGRSPLIIALTIPLHSADEFGGRTLQQSKHYTIHPIAFDARRQARVGLVISLRQLSGYDGTDDLRKRTIAFNVCSDA